jgi:hypothetical protein
MRIAFLLAIVPAAMFAAAPAAAQNVTANPQQIAATMTNAGYKAELTKDPTGDPAIKSEAAGNPFWVLFYNCTDHRNCSTIEFHIAYATKTKPPLTLINEWNRSHRFARAYTDDVADPVLQMDVDLDKGGISTALLKDHLEVWTTLVGQFQKQLGPTN